VHVPFLAAFSSSTTEPETNASRFGMDRHSRQQHRDEPKHHPAASSMSVGSSSPLPVLLMRQERRPLARGLMLDLSAPFT
jgi:hypothetical protein